jgi:hypothetical protein
MRGWDTKSDALFSYVSCEARVPKDHPLRLIRQIVDEALAVLSPEFEQLYAKFGRPSLPPERLLRALLLQAFYSVRSELQLMEQLDYNLLFRWFVGLSVDAEVWDVTELPSQGWQRRAACSWPQWRAGLSRREAHQPDARLDDGFRCSPVPQGAGPTGQARLSGARSDGEPARLVVDTRLTLATGTAEREAALEMVADRPGNHRITLGADKAYDVVEFVTDLRQHNVTPHVAQNTTNRRSAIDGRTPAVDHRRALGCRFLRVRPW